jgi:FAD/FMN-containing dehydrogenase
VTAATVELSGRDGGSVGVTARALDDPTARVGGRLLRPGDPGWDDAVRIWSGGHNIAGTAIAEGGLTLDPSGMREITVVPEARLARVGPGCRLADVDKATQAAGWPPRSASSPRSAWPASPWAAASAT